MDLGICKGVVAVYALFLTAAEAPGPPADQKQVVTEAISRIVESREKTEEYVIQIKQKLKPGTADFQGAREMYTEAMSKHNAWVSLVKNSIQSGKTKNLAKNERYQSVAAEAEQANQQFIRYAQ